MRKGKRGKLGVPPMALVSTLLITLAITVIIFDGCYECAHKKCPEGTVPRYIRVDLFAPGCYCLKEAK